MRVARMLVPFQGSDLGSVSVTGFEVVRDSRSFASFNLSRRFSSASTR